MKETPLHRVEYRLAPRLEDVEVTIQAILAQAKKWGLSEERAQFDLHLAVEEALANALFHGALQIEPVYRERGIADLIAEARSRAARLPYSARKILVLAERLDDAVRITIHDGGPGYDALQAPKETDTESVGGRGLLLIRSFMDAIEHNESGNQITMLKRIPQPLSEPTST